MRYPKKLSNAELEHLKSIDTALEKVLADGAEPPKLTSISPISELGVDNMARTITFIASDETIDRYDRVVKQDGWELDNFKKNPVFLWIHNYCAPPVGRITKIWVESKKLKITVLFPNEGVYPFADLIYGLYSHDPAILNAVSIGWIPLEWENHYDEDDNHDGPRRIMIRNELLEVSGVSVPGNPNAVKDYFASAGLDNMLADFLSDTKSEKAISSEVKPLLFNVAAENKPAWHSWLKEVHQEVDCDGCGECKGSCKDTQESQQAASMDDVLSELRRMSEKINSLELAMSSLSAVNPPPNQGPGNDGAYAELLLLLGRRKQEFSNIVKGD